MSKQGNEQLLGIKYSVKSRGNLGDDKVWKIHSIENDKILQSYWADHIETDEVDLWTGENTFNLEYTLFTEGYVHYENGVLVMTGYETDDDLYPITWEQDKPIMVMFYDYSCKACKQLEPTFDELEKESPDVKFYKTDVEQDRVLAHKFKIEKVPTTIILKNNEELGRVVGVVPKMGLFSLLDKLGENK